MADKNSYRSLAYSLYCDRVRNRTPYCNPKKGCLFGGKYHIDSNRLKFFYPDKFCPTVIAAVNGQADSYKERLNSNYEKNLKGEKNESRYC